MHLPKTFDAVVDEAKQKNLYIKLIRQLNKDFLYANVVADFNEEILPSSLKLILHETIYKLINERFADYLNLLYIIDVSEQKIKQLDGSDTLVLSEQVAFLILQREWQKVWLRNYYS